PVLLLGAATPDDSVDHARHPPPAPPRPGPPPGPPSGSPSAADSTVAGHAGHPPPAGATPPPALQWIMPPEDTGRFMPPGMMSLRPSAAPSLPDTSGRGTIRDLRPRELLRLRDGDSIALTASLVRRTLAGRPLIMYGFNGQQPGP